MKAKIFAGCVLALALLVPAFSAQKPYEVGAWQVERVGTKGPPVILIPGLASGSWAWRETADRLGKTHSVYLLSVPGFDGRAARAGLTLETLQKDLVTLVESKRIGKPVLVGHSMGGTLSLAFASEHSKLIAGVVAVDGLPVFPGTEQMPGDRRAFAEQTRAHFAGQTPEQFAAGQLAYMRTIGTLEEATALVLAQHSSRSDIAATADFAAQLMALDLRPKLAGIKVPVVEISPFHAPDMARFGLDEAGKTAYYRGLLGGIERLEVVSIAPARHFVMFDQPQKFAAALDDALASMFESRAK